MRGAPGATLSVGPTRGASGPIPPGTWLTGETLLEQREGVEQAVADIQRRLAVGSEPTGWLEKVIGSITDEAAFREALQ